MHSKKDQIQSSPHQKEGTKINESTTTEQPYKEASGLLFGGGLNAFYWHQIFALDSAVVKIQNCVTCV